MRVRKTPIWPILIFLFSLLLIAFWGHFDPEAFLIDDNRTQWFPVIEHAYDDFFKTGHMPIYDFFQMKGMAIANPGYYSIMNPLMLVAYVISHFTFVSACTLTVYITIIFSLGNVVFYLLCIELKRSVPESLLFTAAYSVISSFFSVCYWYYGFNNQLFIPLLIYVFMIAQGKRIEYVGCGIVLALEILFGNVQYTCYHYMLFAVLCFVIMFFRKRKMFGILITNVLVGVVLSSPFLLLMLRSSSGFANNEFFAGQTAVTDIVLGSLLPMGILKRMGLELNSFSSNLLGRTDCTWFYNGFFSAFWIIVLCGSIPALIKNLKKDINFKSWIDQVRADHQRQLTTGLIVCLFFFVSLTSGGIVAIILSVVPVIKNFRYLFKVILVIGPVLAILTVSAVPQINDRLYKIAKYVSILFVLVGLVNNYYVVQIVKDIFRDNNYLTFEEEHNYGCDTIKQLEWDTSLYRYATYIDSSGPEEFHYWNGFLRNYATSQNVYSISGYEVAADINHMDDYFAIYQIDNEITKRVNVGQPNYFILVSQIAPDELEKQIKSNAIRYMFVLQSHENPSQNIEGRDNTAELLSALNRLNGIEVEDIRSVNENYNVIILKGMDSLCTDGENANPISVGTMDSLSFQSTGSTEYTLSFSYDKHLNAYIKDNDSSEKLEIVENVDGNTVILVPNGQSGTIHIAYKDPICDLGFCMEIVIVILFMGSLVLCLRKRTELSL